MKEFYITDDGIQLHAKLDMPEKKEKCPLVIVFHGLTGNMEERHITAVSSAMNEIGFATLRVELYGHGKSGGAFEQHNLMKWINNAMTVTDYAKTLDFVTDLYICGHSQGGLLTMLAAGMRADDFKAAIPMSPAIVIPDGARKGNLLGQPFDPEHIPDMVEWGDRHLSGNYLRTAQLLDVDEAIRKYEKPVLLIHGDADEAVPIEYSIDAAKKYKNAKLVQIPGDTHCYDEHLDQVTAAVKKFLGEMENREGRYNNRADLWQSALLFMTIECSRSIHSIVCPCSCFTACRSFPPDRHRSQAS